ncbi:MAG: NifB/NifX family molybdenum-iron cluster-binding protein [Melioribacteraceae bacterium]|nr:NifB/NifX family molybdenum-iron cluster-binding protein [Melioribacteraceae bacterium]
MIICMPTNGNTGLNELVHNHFGSARYYTIYNTESKELSVIENGNDHHSHGECLPVSDLKGSDIDAVLTKGMGKRALQKLNNGGISVFLINNDTVESAIRKFEEGTLVELAVEDACGGSGRGHGHGHHHHHEN